jgi:glycosyltransferase involved in cell wall biosynthesis
VAPGRPVHVLHVLGSLDRGGAETWILQLLQRLDPARVRVDLLVHRAGGAYEEAVRKAGARILCVQPLTRPLEYARKLRGVFRAEGPFDAVHSHVHLFSGYVVRLAAIEGITGRIVHARNASDGRRWSPYRSVYRRVMRAWISRYATHRLAVSTPAADEVFGKGCLESGRCKVMTGVDFGPARTRNAASPQRALLKIPAGARVVGHVGSFRKQKNHRFLVQVAKCACVLDPGLVFVLVGDGRLRESTESAVRHAGLAEHVRFLGERSDVWEILGALDAFVFPSLYEGLPRALLEAQAAGVPCLASTAVSQEAAATPESVRYLALGDGPSAWAAALLEALSSGPVDGAGAAAVREFDARGLTISSNVRALTALYDEIAGLPGR